MNGRTEMMRVYKRARCKPIIHRRETADKSVNEFKDKRLNRLYEYESISRG